MPAIGVATGVQKANCEKIISIIAIGVAEIPNVSVIEVNTLIKIMQITPLFITCVNNKHIKSNIMMNIVDPKPVKNGPNNPATKVLTPVASLVSIEAMGIINAHIISVS